MNAYFAMAVRIVVSAIKTSIYDLYPGWNVVTVKEKEKDPNQVGTWGQGNFLFEMYNTERKKV